MFEQSKSSVKVVSVDHSDIAPKLLQDTRVSFLQSMLNMKGDQNIKVIVGVNVGALNLSLHLHRSFQKLDFSINTNTTNKLSVIDRSKLF